MYCVSCGLLRHTHAGSGVIKSRFHYIGWWTGKDVAWDLRNSKHECYTLHPQVSVERFSVVKLLAGYWTALMFSSYTKIHSRMKMALGLSHELKPFAVHFVTSSLSLYTPIKSFLWSQDTKWRNSGNAAGQCMKGPHSPVVQKKMNSDSGLNK